MSVAHAEDTDLLDVCPDGDFRAMLIRDQYPDEPYDEGAAPILRLEFRRYSYPYAEGVNGSESEDLAAAYNRLAVNAVGDHTQAFDRYLRIFHGARNITAYGPNNYTDHIYMSADTDAWAERVGCPDEYRERASNMDEWIDYLEGDVFTIVLEERQTGACGHHGCEEHQEWEAVDSVGGFYGDNDYTRTAFREHFQPFFGT